MSIFEGDLNFKILYKKHVIFPNSLRGKGLNNYPKLIILSHYGLKWKYISIFVEKTPKVTEIRKYFYLFNPLPRNVALRQHVHQLPLK